MHKNFKLLIRALCGLVLLLLFTNTQRLTAQVLYDVRNLGTVSCELSISLESLTISCDGATACIQVAGGAQPYQVLLNNNDHPDVVTDIDLCFYNLPPGEYQITATDAEGCSAELTIAVPVVDYFIPATVEPINCHGSQDGAINLEIPIDLAPLFFHWEGPNGFTADTENIDQLAAGQYEVSVTTLDNVCVGIGSWEIQEPEPIAIDVIFSPNDCQQPRACALVSGGVPPYYIWVFDQLPDYLADQPSGMITDWTDLDPAAGVPYDPSLSDTAFCADQVVADVYYLLVVDSHFCYAWEEVVVEATGFQREVMVTGASCNGGEGGSICFKVDGAHPPFTTTLTQTPNDAGIVGPEGCFEQLAPGSYVLTTTDAAGCSLSETIIVPNVGNLEATFEITSPPCSESVDGCLRVFGGTPPYRVWAWTWDGPLSDVPDLTFDSAGFPIVADATPVDHFDVTPSPNDPDFFERCAEAIPPGFYLILVIDANGCYVLLPVHIPMSGGDLMSHLDFDQYGSYACVDPSGGTAPYLIRWYDLADHQLIGDEYCIYDLAEGTYYVQIRDQTGCRSEDILFIDERPCAGGTAVVDPDLIHSGEATTFSLVDHYGSTVQWQFKTDITGWLNIPGATEPVYHTPPMHTGSGKLIRVRAKVTCADGSVLYSSVAELELLANMQLAALPAITEDHQLFNPHFRAAELAALISAPNPSVRESWSVYPTVSQGNVQVTVPASLASKKLSVWSSQGQPLQTHTVGSTQTGQTLTLDLSAYAPGIYFIHLRQADGRVYTERVVLQVE